MILNKAVVQSISDDLNISVAIIRDQITKGLTILKHNKNYTSYSSKEMELIDRASLYNLRVGGANT